MLPLEVRGLTFCQTGLVRTSGNQHYSSDKLCKSRPHLNKLEKNPNLSQRRIPQNQENEKLNELVDIAHNRRAGSCPHLEMLESCIHLLHCLSELITEPISDEMTEPDPVSAIH